MPPNPVTPNLPMIYRHILSILILSICTTIALYSQETFTPRLPIDHEKYIEEALSYLLKERPSLKSDNLAFSNIQYIYQQMDPTTSQCGPEGCKIVPAAPFHERLSVSFTVLDSKREIPSPEGPRIEHKQLVVQFPTPRMPQWFILNGTSVGEAIQSTKTK